jgi:hypothetical protein
MPGSTFKWVMTASFCILSNSLIILSFYAYSSTDTAIKWTINKMFGEPNTFLKNAALNKIQILVTTELRHINGYESVWYLFLETKQKVIYHHMK